MKITITSIFVDDQDSALAFYDDVLDSSRSNRLSSRTPVLQQRQFGPFDRLLTW